MAISKTRASSRKRSLTLIGLTAWLMPLPATVASPLRQHRVNPPRRHVPYHHTLTRTERRLARFHLPSSLGPGDPTETQEEDRRRSVSSPLPYERRPHLLADAAAHKDHRRTQTARNGSLHSTLPPHERLADFVNADADGESTSNVTDFDITVTTEYNVSYDSPQDPLDAGPTDPLRTTRDSPTDAATTLTTDSTRTHNASDAPYHHDWFRPLRIRAFLAEVHGSGQYLTDEEHALLLENMVKPALLAWSAALRVDPVQGPLTVDRDQLVDGRTCGPGRDSGLPSAPVPRDHMTHGVEHTDMIVYLDLGFVSTNRTIPRRSVGNHSQSNASLQNIESFWSNLSATVENNMAEFQAQGNATRAQAFAPPPPSCTGEYLAASSFCSTDQYDRPTAAILHICIGDDFFSPRRIHTNIMTMMHELGHALGFNAISLAHFRNPDGSPMTPRVNGAIPETTIECTGPDVPGGREFENVTLPSERILKFRNVRGGVRVAEVVTPSVRQVVRNHFDCQELPGAELESGEFLPLSPNSSFCIGDHWERRLFKMDLMNPIVEDLEYTPRISTITLAYFADSGWYQVDLSRATHAAGWGRGAGCPFIESTCIDADGQVPAGYEAFFCNETPSFDSDGFATRMDGCTSDLSRKATCSMGHYSGSLPFEYQYFNGTYGSDVGGSDPYMDYCPVFAGFTNGLCADAENEALIRVDRMERFGDRNSRCIAGRRQGQNTALCLRIACVVEDQSFRIQVDGVWHSCKKNGAVIVTKSGDRVICPDPVRICPTFYCVLDCLGSNRICDYEQGKCICDGSLIHDLDCDGELDDPFYNPSNQSHLPDQDSPLSDYYVPTARQLKNERIRLLDDWEVSLVACAALLILVAAYFVWKWRRGAVNDQLASNDLDGFHGEAVNPDKHKMMAAVVVDLRIQERNMRSRDAIGSRASETDQSMTDTEGGASHVTDLSMEVAEAEVEEYSPIDPDEPLPCPNTVRRRGKLTF